MTALGRQLRSIAENINIVDLINPGNNYGFWGAENEEVLVLQDANGRMMYSYDMDHLFIPR